eukprot:CCRYP_008780-RA/>CCRYP_008780-RA protein AED:0.04 eAED:0.04 QI:498/1/1/1/1/1/4/447/817
MSSYKERITHALDPSSPSHIPIFLPLIAVARSNDLHAPPDDEDTRPLTIADVDRVMDHANMPDPPPSCLVMHCEPPSVTDEDQSGVVFPKRRATLRGGYLFLSPEATPSSSPPTASGQGPPPPGMDDPDKMKCIPIDGCTVDLPPGGRRVFREHAHTTARAGYELAIRVKPHHDQGGDVATCYIVLESLGSREAWASAIRMRCDVGKNKVTLLRPGGIAGGRLMAAAAEEMSDNLQEERGDRHRSMVMSSKQSGGKKHRNSGFRKTIKGSSMALDSQGTSSGNADLDEALAQFSGSKFEEAKWVHKFLQRHAVSDLSSECDKLEKWMDVIKNSLRGAVLEQYEYFVEASREMTTMGREVAWLRTLVERQQETLMGMKNIDFGAGLEEMEEEMMDRNGDYSSEDEVMLLDEINDDEDDVSTSSSDEEGPAPGRTPMRNNLRSRRKENRRVFPNISGLSSVDEEQRPPSPRQGQEQQTYIEIPSWIIDVTEEISSLIKESRYTDAADLILKAKAEVAELLSAQDSNSPVVANIPTSLSSSNTATTSASTAVTSATTNALPKKLHKKQQTLLQRTSLQIDSLTDRMTKRLAENLRRKNEALKASAKRERADPLSTLAPLPSPACLNDDAVALGLLVKLSRHQEAATAYAARRSLVLSECLHERPISSPIGMDAVIYSAQLSSSFFSSLATAVEGFLDLFDGDAGKTGSDDDTSLNSKSLGGVKRVPSGALSAIVLWCDSELAKFANVFGSSRLLGSLALSPPGMRRKEDQTGASRSNFMKEREHSIEVAARCVEQAFSFASENLDSIGLPLVQLLGKNIR